MDTFMEKIVARKKSGIDALINAAIVTAAILLIFIILQIQILFELGLWMLLAVGIVYLAFRLITSRNIEYEYVVTNGDLDIDKIIARRKRKRIFSANCKDFDVIAKVSSSGFSQALQNTKTRIDASGSANSEDAYYITLNYKGERTIVIFEPDERMLNNFKTYIPRKVLLN